MHLFDVRYMYVSYVYMHTNTEMNTYTCICTVHMLIKFNIRIILCMRSYLKYHSMHIIVNVHCFTASGLSSFTSSSCVCKDCSNKIMSELVYIYRSEIPMDDLPGKLLSNCIHMYIQ